ncbi:MAG TPA: LpxL/LpxP family Kdo(2)-lipid IV(A) lauroyl/palmitoleoyl acyltransferase [Gammaproteobacteria bacterium]
MESSSFTASHFLAPRFWPTWIGLALLRLLSLLPYPVLLWLGRAIGGLIYHLAAKRRHVAEVNIIHCFPHLNPAEQQRLVRESFDSSAIALFEGGMSWWGSTQRLRQLQRIEGIEHLQQALALGKGAILLGGHYTTLEISGRLLAFHTDRIYPIYKPARNALFDAVMVSARQRLFDGLLDNSDMRAILRTLKQGNIIWYAPDQDFGMERSVFAPFFGVQTATLTTTARLAKLSGAPLLPFYSQRLPGTQGYLLRILPPLTDFPSGDDVRDATRVNQVIEAGVNFAPGQYLWVHRRFKSRPPGVPPLYQR